MQSHCIRCVHRVGRVRRSLSCLEDGIDRGLDSADHAVGGGDGYCLGGDVGLVLARVSFDRSPAMDGEEVFLRPCQHGGLWCLMFELWFNRSPRAARAQELRFVG